MFSEAFVPVGDHVAELDLSSVVSVMIPANATGILIQAPEQNLWYKFDGNDPAADDGFPLTYDFGVILWHLSAGTEIRFIEESSGGKLMYQFVRFLERSETR